MSFDLTISFDKAEYLNPQLYMFVDTLKDNIPDDTILHIVTNRSEDNELIQWIQQQIPTKIYNNNGENTDHLKSRCKYMFNCFEVETDKSWLIKMEADMVILKHLDAFEEIIQHEGGIHGCDIILEPENRKIFNDISAHRLWRIIYNAMGMKYPRDTFIEFRENREIGLPLFGTGLIIVNSKHLDTINKRWVPLTKICEKWIDLNIHPNEFAFTGMIFDEGWKWWTYDAKYKFNPIGHFRKGSFPSTELIDNCKLPDDTIIFDYHRPEWLMHVAKYNPQIMKIIEKNKQYIPNDWWQLTSDKFMEKN